MKPAQASMRFSTIPIQGWNGSAWVTTPLRANLDAASTSANPTHTAQQFSRFMYSQDVLDPQYEVIRFPGGEVCLVAILSTTYSSTVPGEVVKHVYQLFTAPYQAQVIGYTTTKLASGVAGAATETVLASTFVNLNRQRSTNSPVTKEIAHSTLEVMLPGSMYNTLDRDKRLKILDDMHIVQEVILDQGVTLAYCSRL